MNTTYVDPLIPPVETTGETLTRLLANIATLSGIIAEAEGRGRIHLARVFTRARAAKVFEAREKIAQVRAVATPPAATGHQSIREVPVGDLPLPPEVRQWQRAVNEGWKQTV